jgi:hypothetical protein
MMAKRLRLALAIGSVREILRAPLVELHVLRDRLELIACAIPHLWRHSFDFDFMYPIHTLCWRLRRLERVLDNDPWHADAAKYAQEIRRFLVLIADSQDASDVVPKSPAAERHGDLSLRKMLDHSRPGYDEWSAWSNTVQRYEERAWNDAWKLFRKRARYWWS